MLNLKDMIPVEIEQLELKRIQLTFREIVPNVLLQSLKFETEELPHLRSLAFKLRAYLLGTKHETVGETIRVPISWWEHWKQDHAPAWFGRRFPVKTREVVVKTYVTNICPHWPHKVDVSQQERFSAFRTKPETIDEHWTFRRNAERVMVTLRWIVALVLIGALLVGGIVICWFIDWINQLDWPHSHEE